MSLLEVRPKPMMRYKDSALKKFIKNDRGFVVFEWTYLLIVFLILIVILLPDIVVMGRTMFHAHGASSYAIQRVAEQGHMNESIANEVFSYMEDRGIKDCTQVSQSERTCFQLFGTNEMRGINSEDPRVEVRVDVYHRPILLALYPNIRREEISLAGHAGVVNMSSKRMDVSMVYIR